MSSFTLATTPFLIFGEGKRAEIPQHVLRFGNHCLIIIGANSFASSTAASDLWDSLRKSGIHFSVCRISGEPTPSAIDECVAQHLRDVPDVVVAIGGGAVLDAGKAIAAMLTTGGSVRDYLEGIGTSSHPGTTRPLIAVPTTSGTGSEATKNAVISEVGSQGYKRSLRHENFIPAVSILDPELTYTCPAHIAAASGMDAFTQLLESYVSTKANAFTDALAMKGLALVVPSLIAAVNENHPEARRNMMLGAYLSGITLANAGLGLVHGFASSIGGYFDIPHGVICSRLMGPVNRITIRELRHTKEQSSLQRYADVGMLLPQSGNHSQDACIDNLLDFIEHLTTTLHIPGLGTYGVTTADFQRIAAITENKNNPVAISQAGMLEVLTGAL
jgi:alcohol dehydrogenase class IV